MDEAVAGSEGGGVWTASAGVSVVRSPAKACQLVASSWTVMVVGVGQQRSKVLGSGVRTSYSAAL